jgi:hypothetical protein
MTCIVGIEHENGVIIGGDSAGVAGWTTTMRADEKVFRVGDYIMGNCGSPRMAQLLRYVLDVRTPHGADLVDMDRFMATVFVDACRKAFKDGGVVTVKDGCETCPGSFLVGICGRLYNIQADFQFSRSQRGHQSVGCGDEIALGSLHTTAQYDIDPEMRVTLALEAAAEISGGVVPPFVILEST